MHRARYTTSSIDKAKVAEAQANNMGLLAGFSWRHTDPAIKREIAAIAPVLAERLSLVDQLADDAGIALSAHAVLR